MTMFQGASSLRSVDMKSLGTELVRIRHALHKQPERGYHEYETSTKIANHLREFGVDEVHTGIAGTGVVGVINGKCCAVDRVVGLRAELDGLALEEQTGLPWASQNSGVMHACGHDGHMSMLLGAAAILAKCRDYAGRVCVIFQPAEEGGAGACAMLDAGFLTRFPLDAIYAIHNAPWLPIGKFAANAGPMMAAANRVEISVSGAGGHGGMPNLGVDAILACAHAIVASQSIISRDLDPLDNAVVSFAAIQAGDLSQYNVLPSMVHLIGTIRTFSVSSLIIIEKRLREIVTQICAAYDATANLKFSEGYPATINNHEKAELVMTSVAALFGAESAIRSIKPSTAAEDFAFFLKRIPGAFIWAGAGHDKAESLHSPTYDFDDRLLLPGAMLLAEIAKRELSIESAFMGSINNLIYPDQQPL